MLLEFLTTLIVASFISLVGYLLVLGAENRRKYKFFEKNAPGLKVVENGSLFGGHSNQLMHTKHNWAKVEKVLDKYGPTVGLFISSQPAVLTKDLDLIKVFTIEEQFHVNRIRPGIPIKELEEDCIMFAEDEQWLRLRKVIGTAFSAHKLKTSSAESDISIVIDKFIAHIELKLEEAKRKMQEDSAELDVEDISHRYALSLVFTNFYKQDNVVDFSLNEDKYVKMIDRNLSKIIGFFLKACAAFPILLPVVNWLIMNFDDQGFLRRTIMDYIKQQTKLNFDAAREIEEARKKGRIGDSFDSDNFTLQDGSKFKRNMIDYVTDEYRNGKLTRSEYLNSTFFLFFAANKTVADPISRLLYNLANHPEVQEKLRESLLVSGTNSEYLSWVVNETLRLNPPAPIGCSRKIERDIETKHGLIPAGTFVVTPACTINRLKEYWGQDADEFRPERWANAKDFHPVQFLSFGAGRRTCPGKELALMEIKMLANALIRKYKFQKSTIHTTDNSKLFTSPVFVFLVYDTPTYIRVSRLE